MLYFVGGEEEDRWEESVGNMATTEMTQMIKVVIDGNRLFMENRGRNTEAETQMLQHKCELLQHKCKHRR
jgi:hypothetical protein